MTTPEELRAQIAAAVPELVAAREGTFLDTCTVTRPPAGEQTPALDQNAMPLPGADDVPVYSGLCTVADPRTAQRSGRTVNDEAGVPGERILRVPNGSPDLQPGDLVTVTTSVLSPGLVGDRFLVVGEQERSYATHRRYALGGSSWQSPPSSP